MFLSGGEFMKNIKRALCIMLSAVMTAGSLVMRGAELSADAEEQGYIVVSLGDSYSSGEGILPFYGQDKAVAERVTDPDWLAHRSTEAWPGKLILGDDDRPLSEKRGSQWFFASATGARTTNIGSSQKREYYYGGLSGTEYLPAQLSVITDNDLYGKVDYVTLTIGGNDLGFPTILINSILHQPNAFKKEIDAVWEDFDAEGGTGERIKQCYYEIAEAAGPQAEIIVAGYPTLYNPGGVTYKMGSDVPICAENCVTLNEAVFTFNEKLNSIVSECYDEGLNICFVDVAEEFAGHEAFTDDPYIFPIKVGSGVQDIDSRKLADGSSIHPNAKGAAVYAAAVQAVIDSEGKGRQKKTHAVTADIQCENSDPNVSVSVNGAEISQYAGAEKGESVTVKISTSVDAEKYSYGVKSVYYTADGGAEKFPVGFEADAAGNVVCEPFVMPDNDVTIHVVTERTYTVNISQSTKFSGYPEDVRAVKLFAGDRVTVSAPAVHETAAAIAEPFWRISGSESCEPEKSADGKNVTFTMPAADISVSCVYCAAENTVIGCSVTLGGETGVNFYIMPTADTALYGYAAVQGPNDAAPVRYDFADMTPTVSGYRISSSVYSSQMDSAVQVKLYDANGKVQTLCGTDGKKLGDGCSATVKMYIDFIRANSDRYSPALTGLVNALNDYGALSQKYFGTAQTMTASTENIAGVTAAETEKYKAEFIGTKPEGFTFKGASVVLREVTAIRLYYDAAEAQPVITLDGRTLESRQNADGRYVEIPAVASHDLDKTYTVCFDGYEVRVSALSYVHTVLEKYEETGENADLAAVCKALYNYSVKADAYFDNEN